MKQLDDKIGNKCLYVKNGVIFNILGYNNGDSCAVELSESNTPYIKVNGMKKYFGSLIEVGDTYTNNIFKKTIHGGNSETEKTFPNYYHDICEEELASLITQWNLPTIEDFKNNLKYANFPVYMINGMGYNVEGIEQIDLTEEKYKQFKENKLRELALDAAKKTVRPYGYKVTTQRIDIEELS